MRPQLHDINKNIDQIQQLYTAHNGYSKEPICPQNIPNGENTKWKMVSHLQILEFMFMASIIHKTSDKIIWFDQLLPHV